MLFGQKLNSHRIIRRQAKSLIRQRTCTGCLEDLRVAHNTLFESHVGAQIYLIVFGNRSIHFIPFLPNAVSCPYQLYESISN